MVDCINHPDYFLHLSMIIMLILILLLNSLSIFLIFYSNKFHWILSESSLMMIFNFKWWTLTNYLSIIFIKLDINLLIYYCKSFSSSVTTVISPIITTCGKWNKIFNFRNITLLIKLSLLVVHIIWYFLKPCRNDCSLHQFGMICSKFPLNYVSTIFYFG